MTVAVCSGSLMSRRERREVRKDDGRKLVLDPVPEWLP